MKKLTNKAGLTLIEMMVALLIMVFLVLGMGVGMDAGSRIYQDAVFESDSATLASTLNTSLGDILRYSREIRENDGVLENYNGDYIVEEDVGFVFTNYEYGIQDAYFYTPIYEDGTSKGVLQMKNLKNAEVVELINAGTYPNLVVSNFEITYVAAGSNSEGAAGRGGYFDISYTIYSVKDESKSREVECVIRLMNE